MGVAQLRELAGRKRQFAAHLVLDQLPRVSALKVSEPRSAESAANVHVAEAGLTDEHRTDETRTAGPSPDEPSPDDLSPDDHSDGLQTGQNDEVGVPEVGVPEVGVQVQLRVDEGAYGFPEVLGSVQGSLALDCQRCLGRLDWPVDLAFRLAVVESEADLEDLAERFEALVAGRQGVSLHEIVEDEILASLPLAPMHSSAAECSANVGLDAILPAAGEVAAPRKGEGPDTTRPFAELKGLLRDAD
jgi:uncharacterized metal-binding protein YceD (DUF177 family)